MSLLRRCLPATLALVALLGGGFSPAHASGKAKAKKKKPKVQVPVPPPPPPTASASAGPGKGLTPLKLRELEQKRKLRELQKLKEAMGHTTEPGRVARLVESTRRVKPGIFQAGVHPFFNVRASDEVGSFQVFKPGTGVPPVRCLQSTPEGHVAWLNGTSNTVQVLATTGGPWALPIEGNASITSLARDSKGQLCVFGDQNWGTLSLAPITVTPEGDNLPYTYDQRPYVEDAFGGSGPVCVAAANGGNWQGFSRHALFNLEPTSRTMKYRKLDPALVPAAVAWDPALDSLFCVHPSRDEIHLSGRIELRKPLPMGSRPQGVALGPREGKVTRVWATLAGRDGVMAIDPATGKETFCSLAGDGGPSGPRGITLGPDNNLWVALETGHAIARIKPSGEVTRFKLRDTMSPLEISASGDGRVWFSLANSPDIGAMTVVPMVRPGAPALHPAEGKEEARTTVDVLEPRAPLPKLSREERHRRHDELLRKAEEQYEARLARERELGIAGQSYLGDAGPVENKTEGKEPPVRVREERKGTAPTVLTLPARVSMKRLKKLGVLLTPRGLKHVFDDHGAWKNPGKSQFAEAFDSEDSLAHLLADRLDDLGAGMIGREVDRNGNRYTYGRTKEDLWYYNETSGRHYPTHAFRVVTMDIPFEGKDYQLVLTAHPVSESY